MMENYCEHCLMLLVLLYCVCEGSGLVAEMGKVETISRFPQNFSKVNEYAHSKMRYKITDPKTPDQGNRENLRKFKN